jgi:translation initiation factor 4E
MTLIWL